MKNSTAPDVTQRPKRQGPIRVEAIGPLLIIVALVWAYTHFLLDGHLRRGFEYAATQGVGAEVNIGAVKTSFWGASMELRDIQVTDVSQPANNLIQLGSIRLQLLWDGLLRGKAVVEHADVLDIQLDAPRAKPGFIVPPKPGSVGTPAEALLAKTSERFAGNALGDLAAIAGGAEVGSQIDKLDDNLKTSARLAELTAELERKQQEWNSRLDGLPKPESVRALEARLRNVKIDRFKDVQEVQASLKELEAIRDEIDAGTKNVRTTGTALDGDVNGYKGAYAEIDRLVKQDIADLQAHFGLPKLDAGSLSSVLFGPAVLNKVADARRYMDQAREYMPPKRTDDEKAAQRLAPRERAKGQDYAFGKPNSYPLFWLKQATISSRSSAGANAGELEGELRDVTSDPVALGRPVVGKLRGAFPHQGIQELRVDLLADHTGEVATDRLDVAVGGYPIAGRNLVTSDEVSLGFDRATGASVFTAELRGDAVKIGLENSFTETAYKVEARSPLVREIVSGAVTSVDKVNLIARVTGTWDKLDWYLATNLGDELERAFRKQVEAQIAKAQARLEAMVNERIGAERAKLQARVAETEKHLRDQVAAKQQELDKLRGQADQARTRLEEQKNAYVKAQEKQLKDAADKKLKSGADNALKDLRKRF